MNLLLRYQTSNIFILLGRNTCENTNSKFSAHFINFLKRFVEGFFSPLNIWLYFKCNNRICKAHFPIWIQAQCTSHKGLQTKISMCKRTTAACSCLNKQWSRHFPKPDTFSVWVALFKQEMNMTSQFPKLQWALRSTNIRVTRSFFMLVVQPMHKPCA